PAGGQNRQPYNGVRVTDLPTRTSDPTPDELKRRFAVLERVAILFTLSDNILRALARQLQPVTVSKGSTIIKQGEPGDSLFIIESGRCEPTVEDSPGHQSVIALWDAGDCFWEMGLISGEPADHGMPGPDLMGARIGLRGGDAGRDRPPPRRDDAAPRRAEARARGPDLSRPDRAGDGRAQQRLPLHRFRPRRGTYRERA